MWPSFSSFVTRAFFHLGLAALCTTANAQALTVKQFRLQNGLNVVVNPDTSFSEVALYLFADAGFRKEAQGQHGIAHLFEHVMLPTRYQYNPELYRNSAQHFINSNAQVFNDYVRFYVQYDKNGIDYGLIGLADRLDFQMDSLTDDQLQRHINNVNSEISRAESFGSFRWRPVFRDAASKGIFGTLHPYGHEQSLTDINRVTKKDIANWYKRWYGAANATLLIMGNVDTATIRSKVETYFGFIEPGKQSLHTTFPVPAFNEPRITEIELAQKKNIVYTAWAIPGYGSREDDVSRLLSVILTDETTGLLTKALERAGIKEAKVSAQTESYQQASVFDIVVEFSNAGDRRKVEDVIRNEIKKFTETPVATAFLSAAFEKYALQFTKAMEDIGQNDDRVVELGHGSLFLNNPLYYVSRLGYLQKLTPRELQVVLANWLRRPAYLATIKGRDAGGNGLAYDFKKSIAYTAPSPPKALPVETIKMGDHLTMHIGRFNRLPVVNIAVAFGNEAGVSADEMSAYKKPLQQFFEKDPGFSALVAKGLQSETEVRGNMLFYRLSMDKKLQGAVMNWLAAKLHNFTELRGEKTAAPNEAGIDQTLALLKWGGTGRTTAGVYPLSSIDIVVTGDAERNMGTTHPEAAKATLAVQNSSGETSRAGNILRNIGETPTSLMTLGHKLRPQNIGEEVAQMLLLHMLRAKLMANLREKNGLVYEIYPYSTSPVQGGVLAFWQTSTAVEKTEKTVEQIYIELGKLTEDLDRKLTTAKTRVLAELKSKYKSLESFEQTILDDIAYHHPADYVDQVIAALNATDAASFKSFLETKAKPEQFQLVLFTSPKVETALKAKTSIAWDAQQN